VPRGFTLLETLAALAITALVLAALGGTVLGAARARARSADAADRTAAVRALLLRLAAELEAAHPPARRAPDLDERFAVDAARPSHPWSSLRLATVAPDARGSGPATDVHSVTYGVAPDPAHPGSHALVRRTAVVPGGAETTAVPVLRGVRRFTVRCFDGTRWRESWLPGPLPRAVAVTLAAERVDELTVTVTLPASRG
jgi:prepilin-type N-terminal cleavage/methylation domain-containing protein